MDPFEPGSRRVKGFTVIALLLCAELAAAEYAIGQAAKPVRAERALPLRAPPLPRPPIPAVVPQQLSPPQASSPLAESAGAEPSAALPPTACQLRLAQIAVFKPIPLLNGPGECGAEDAVLLERVILIDQARVAIAPAATLRCAMAEEVALWLRDDVASAALKLGAPLRRLDNFDSYECRGRNRVQDAKLSEHGRANALDVRALRLANGEVVGLTDVNVAKGWREELRASACAHFSTVLGPGSDGYHEEHIHIDLAERRGGYKMCEWDVREPVKEIAKTDADKAAATLEPPVPLPRPRPTAGMGDAPAPFKKTHSHLR